MSAASATRSKTTVSGGNSRNTTPLKKNEPPHSTESRPSSDQSRASILFSSRIHSGSISALRRIYSGYQGHCHPIPVQARTRRYFGLDTISIILPSSSSGACAFALS